MVPVLTAPCRRVGLVLGAIALTSFVPLAAAETCLQLSAGFPKGLRAYEFLESAAKEVQAKTESRVRIELIPETSLGKDPLPRVESGELSGAVVGTAMLASRSPTAALLGLPLVASDFDQANAIDAEFAAQIAKELEPAGFEVVARASMGFAVLLSQSAILIPKDLAGHRMFAPNQPGSKFDFKWFGATPVPLLFDEVEANLKLSKEKGEGGIDCVIGLPDLVILKQWHRHLRHQLDLPIFVVDLRLVVAKKSMESISETDREIVEQTLAAGFAAIERDRREREPSYRRVLERAGFKMNAPSPEQLAEWEIWRKSAWAELGKSLAIDEAHLAALEAARDRARVAAQKKP